MERDGETVLACDDFALGSAIGKPHVDRTIVEPWYKGRAEVPNRDRILFGALASLKERFQASPGLVEGEWFPMAAADLLGMSHRKPSDTEFSLGDTLRRLRRAKDPDEIAVLKRCIRAAEAGQRRAREVLQPGMTELEIYEEIQSTATEELGEPALIYGDFRASTPTEIHVGGPPRSYALQEGDTLILDFSVVVAGYRCDFTNTLAVGTPSKGQQRLMDLCRVALGEGEKALKPGRRGRDIYQAVNAPLAEAGHPLQHHAGHGLGMGHPEAPAFVPENEEILGNGEVVTLEPGIYAEGIGAVRVEHNFLLTDSGCERLTHHELAL